MLSFSYQVVLSNSTSNYWIFLLDGMVWFGTTNLWFGFGRGFGFGFMHFKIFVGNF